jgi:hypothetical protein
MSGEDEQTERVRNQGKPDGLFRACMDEIRSSHTTGQALRTAALAVGLLSDANCYAELLGQFYVVTAALEKRMDELIASSNSGDDKKSSLLVAKVKDLGYSFTCGYENDLQALLGQEWKGIVRLWTTEPAKQYTQVLESANDIECVAAAFILHGPLVIGGGAMLKPRVEKAFGGNTVNVFGGVIGTARGGRSSRRREFIELYDTLLENDVDSIDHSDRSSGDYARFSAIVEKCGEFMKLNNQMMVAVRQKPWWRKYVAATVAAIVSAVVWRIVTTNTESGTISNTSRNVRLK